MRIDPWGHSTLKSSDRAPGCGEPLRELDLTGPTTFVLGAEREGLPADVLDRCDARATIPLRGDAESLNVAMAGTIALYEWTRRNETRPGSDPGTWPNGPSARA
jgi:tRNA G18 (ribose-2'-O)-methylase SpoU